MPRYLAMPPAPSEVAVVGTVIIPPRTAASGVAEPPSRTISVVSTPTEVVRGVSSGPPHTADRDGSSHVARVEESASQEASESDDGESDDGNTGHQQARIASDLALLHGRKSRTPVSRDAFHSGLLGFDIATQLDGARANERRAQWQAELTRQASERDLQRQREVRCEKLESVWFVAMPGFTAIRAWSFEVCQHGVGQVHQVALAREARVFTVACDAEIVQHLTHGWSISERLVVPFMVTLLDGDQLCATVRISWLLLKGRWSFKLVVNGVTIPMSWKRGLGPIRGRTQLPLDV